MYEVRPGDGAQAAGNDIEDDDCRDDDEPHIERYAGKAFQQDSTALELSDQREDVEYRYDTGDDQPQCPAVEPLTEILRYRQRAKSSGLLTQAPHEQDRRQNEAGNDRDDDPVVRPSDAAHDARITHERRRADGRGNIGERKHDDRRAMTTEIVINISSLATGFPPRPPSDESDKYQIGNEK